MSERVKIVVPGDDPVMIAGSPHLDRLVDYGDVVLYEDRPATVDEKIARVEGAAVIINTRGVVTWRKEEFERCRDLKMITSCSIGTDMFDLIAAREHGVVICNQPGRTAPVVAEHMFGLMFAAAKRAAYLTSEMKKGEWPRIDLMTLQGKKLGIVGTGNIGAEMARLGRAVGMEVLAWTYNPSAEREKELGVRFVPFDELLGASDVVSMHVKLTEESRGLMGTREFGLMKEGSILLNGARGPVVDSSALVEALDSGHLGGAGIDVFDEEPIPTDHPLLGCEHVVLTPHCADMTPEGVDLLNGGAVDNVINYLKGTPHNIVS